ncbi:hypothetical protein KBB96_04975 [Luteolibacter ambystomatis]|uniref:Uncharacterized protein n=1 Tax=Luteolibacter ambystomatis TaxID=2824561 RepID=A0A975J1E1_9BACT|nr:hypothetical protein [Luteolibacter ambystomatis]QUE52245.1 hypothetical protein KBB96_04975 [Luteolibacter ambystomatis]
MKKPTRKPTSVVKREVLRRFGGRCALCLAEALSGNISAGPPRTMRPEMAHFQAWSRNKSSGVENLIPLCLDHHERFDKQNQGERVAALLTGILEGRLEVSDSTVERMREEFLKLPNGRSFGELRQEIWTVKAAERLGRSLLVEEAQILCKVGQPSEAWESLRIFFGVFASPNNYREVSDALAVAGEVALAYGDASLGIALFRESESHLITARQSEKIALTSRIRLTRGIANCLLMSTATGNRLLTHSALELAARDARQAAKRDADFVASAANLEALCIVRNALGDRKSGAKPRPKSYVNRLASLDATLQGIDPLGAAYRAVNVGQVLLILGCYPDASDALEAGKSRLEALGEIENATVAAHQQVEALVKGMTGSRASPDFGRVHALLKRCVRLAGNVSNDDRYWRNMIGNLEWLERSQKDSRGEITPWSFDAREAHSPFQLGALLPKRWPVRTTRLRSLIASRGGGVRMSPLPNMQELVDLRGFMKSLVVGSRPRSNGHR